MKYILWGIQVHRENHREQRENRAGTQRMGDHLATQCSKGFPVWSSDPRFIHRGQVSFENMHCKLLSSNCASMWPLHQRHEDLSPCFYIGIFLIRDLRVTSSVSYKYWGNALLWYFLCVQLRFMIFLSVVQITLLCSFFNTWKTYTHTHTYERENVLNIITEGKLFLSGEKLHHKKTEILKNMV